MQYISTSAGWVAPPEVSGWISPTEVAESSGWVSPYESSGLYDDEFSFKMDPALKKDMDDAGGQTNTKDKNVSPIIAAVTSIVDPITGMVKWFTGGKEIGLAQAQAMIEEAKAKQELAKAQALMALKTQPQGISTNTMLLLGAGALVLFLALR